MLAYKELTGKSKFDFLSDLKYLYVVTMANYEERSANAMEEIVSFLSENVNCANLNIEVTCFTLKTQNSSWILEDLGHVSLKKQKNLW